jgi:hypothetical protein
MSQVGTFLAYANGSVWTWVDGELYLPEHWFAPEMAELREKLGIPSEREFETKIELGGKMIPRTHTNGLRGPIPMVSASRQFAAMISTGKAVTSVQK